MNHLALPRACAALALLAAGPVLAGDAMSETLLDSTIAWDGTPYPHYGPGQPQVSVLRIHIPPHSQLAWHRHPVINAAYLVTGELTVERRDNGKTRVVRAGEVLPELVDAVHRGYTGEQAALLVVFYAGIEGMPITLPDEQDH